VLLAAAPWGFTARGQGTTQQTEARRAADLAAIRELHRRDIAATQAFDVETLLSLLTDDVVSLPPGHAPVVGKPAVRAMLESMREQSKNIEVLVYEHNWQQVHLEGGYAFEWGAFVSTVRLNRRDTIRETLNALRILQRQPDGSWKVYRTIWNEGPAASPESKEQ
jgi:ketosteroid isomerase-like protein